MGDDFEAFLIVEADSSGPGNANVCELVRRTNNLTNFTVLYDPSGLLDSLRIGGRHHHRVLREGSVLEFQQSFNDSGFVPVLQRLLP